MSQPNNKYLFPILLGFFLSFPLSVPAATELNISDIPLSVVSSVEPNVMFLLDNSGSMDNVVWYQGNGSTIPAYDTTATYEEWCGNCTSNDRWDPTDTYMQLKDINTANTGASGSCGSQTLSSVTIGNYTVPRYWVEGEYNSTTKCLILPDISNNGKTHYTGHYLDYLFQYFNDGDDLTTVIPFKNRLMVMKEVTTDLIDNTGSMRFGLTKFGSTNNSGWGTVVSECGDPINQVSNKIDALSASTRTPLASAMYEITRYFRGMTSLKTGDTYTSPIQYSCQKNFVITVTDGLPTNDTTFSSTDPAISTDCPDASCAIPNWDGLTDASASNPYLPRFKDGSGSVGDEGGRLYYDDMVKFAYDVDMKTGAGFDSPPFNKQNIETYTVGFSIANQMLRDAGHYGSGRVASDAEEDPPTHYFTADDENQLKEKLTTALTRIEGESGSAGSVAATTGFVGGGTSLYQGLYDTNSWSGKLFMYNISISNNTVYIPKVPDVDASVVLANRLAQSNAAKNRTIISYNPDIAAAGPGAKGIDFSWSSLSTTQKAYLNDREEILDYIRGDQSCETNSTGSCTNPKVKDLRDRKLSAMLGTIIDSTPMYIANPLEYYPSTWNGTNAPENAAAAEKYTDFKTNNQSRQGIVYVGANDGMLHAFNAKTLDEVMAYIPNAVYPKLADLADTNHTHSYYVDGTPSVIDAFFGDNVGGDNKWHTILAGGLNNGGQGIYALDITDPSKFSSAATAKKTVLWEFTDSDDRDLGYTYSQPAIVRMHNGVWAVVFGNGYNNTEIDEGDSNNDGITDINDDTNNDDSSTGDAVLYIVNARTGALILKIDTGVGSADDPTGNKRPNGLATVAPVDIDDDYIVDYIYAGDLFGNLWRFDVTGPSAGSWKIFGKGNPSNKDPIFQASYTGSNPSVPQAITSRPDVAITESGGMMVYFGTGQYLQLSDITDKSVQSFYGLLDDPTSDSKPPFTSTAVTRSAMIKQTINAETTYSSGGNSELVRSFSNNASDNYASWYIDLMVQNGSPQGERVVGAPIVRGVSRKKIVFTSIIPTEDICGFGGKSWLIELDARNGNMTTSPVFDLNFDGKLDKLDNGGSGADVYNGWSQEGIQTTPAILKDKKIEYKILSGSTGILRAVGETPNNETEGERQSWRQIK